MEKRLKLENKGFSLVELIIVIAIMAILIAVLAPMFIRYIERSRISVDVESADGMAGSLRAAALDTSLSDSPPDFMTLVWATNGAITVTTTDSSLDAVYQQEVHRTVGASVQMRSQAAINEGPVEIEIESVPGIIRISLNGNPVQATSSSRFEVYLAELNS